MALAIVHTRASEGVEAPPVTVEVHLSGGLPALSIVGLPETAVRESKDRVRSALLNSRFEFPARRITVNLAPADLPKEGGRYDLPIAMGILAASGQIPPESLDGHEFVGELALSGMLRPVRGIVPIAIFTRDEKRTLFFPADNRAETSLIKDLSAYAADHLLEVTGHLAGHTRLAPLETIPPSPRPDHQLELSDVHGQYHAKRALAVTAAGGHNLLMIGPPGTGKTMLASRLPGILPPMTEQEALETATVYSICHHGFEHANWARRPFRAPHHTASAAALVGGGGIPRPGEISLSHNGVLFLDELAEFNRHVLDVLREPMETGHVTISRAMRKDCFPARFQLVAAMNPCPGGRYAEGSEFDCTHEEKRRYLARISGPLLDRFDLHIEVPRLSVRQLQDPDQEDGPVNNSQIRERVIRARERQLQRAGKPNHALSASETEQYCRLGTRQQRLLESAIERLKLSARAWHRILRMTRTIADLEDHENIDDKHLAEAIAYRSLERKQTNGGQAN